MDYCLFTNYATYSQYDGNYFSAGTYDEYSYFTGDGATIAYIYYSTGSTCWCLSTSLGGTCILFGGNSCQSPTPNFSSGFFSNSVCPTPTPTPTTNCGVLDISAFFDCDIIAPTPSVTPTMTVTPTSGYTYPTPTPTMTPSPTASSQSCSNVNFCFNVQNFGLTPTPTPTMTPTSGAGRNTIAGGTRSFITINDNLICPPPQIV